MLKVKVSHEPQSRVINLLVFLLVDFYYYKKKSVDLTKIDVFDRELAFAVLYVCVCLFLLLLFLNLQAQIGNIFFFHLELLDFFPSF